MNRERGEYFDRVFAAMLARELRVRIYVCVGSLYTLLSRRRERESKRMRKQDEQARGCQQIAPVSSEARASKFSCFIPADIAEGNRGSPKLFAAVAIERRALYSPKTQSYSPSAPSRNFISLFALSLSLPWFVYIRLLHEYVGHGKIPFCLRLFPPLWFPRTTVCAHDTSPFSLLRIHLSLSIIFHLCLILSFVFSIFFLCPTNATDTTAILLFRRLPAH